VGHREWQKGAPADTWRKPKPKTVQRALGEFRRRIPIAVWIVLALIAGAVGGYLLAAA
jgi:hypothetical protein